MGAKEYLSVTAPIVYVAAIVTNPVTMPERPLTVATDPLSNRSDGSVRKIVAQAAYPSVARPNSAISSQSRVV